MAGRVVTEEFESAVLQGNRPGDPHVRPVSVYLPEGYGTDASRRYPVLWLILGFTGAGPMSLHDGDPWAESMPARLDRLIGSGAMAPAIMVFPDCFTRFGGSQYINSSATGRYEDYLVQELAPWIKGKYACGRHGIVGKSSGGYGALIQGMRHPELFEALACHSGDALFEFSYLPEFPRAMDTLRRTGGVEGFMKEFEAAPTRRNKKFNETLNALAMSACYLPKDDEPLGFELPFCWKTGALREAAWNRMLEWDPVRRMDHHLDALRGLRLLYVDCGTRDEWNLYWGSRLLSHRMKEKGIEHQYEEFEDGHMNISYRYDVSLPRLAAALA